MKELEDYSWTYSDVTFSAFEKAGGPPPERTASERLAESMELALEDLIGGGVGSASRARARREATAEPSRPKMI